MKWKKILSLVIVSVLVIGAFTVISSSTRAQTGQRVTSIEFGVQLSQEQGALNAADGKTHFFMQTLSGPVWQGLPDDVKANLDTWEAKSTYNNWFINPAHEGHGTAAITEAVDNGWINDATDVEYLANNYEDKWTVNPFAHNDVRFAMQYLDRQSLVQDLILGWGNPRYGPMAAETQLWDQYFVDAIENKYGTDPSGNQAWFSDFIQNGMMEIKNYVDTHPNMGEVTQESGNWYYNHPNQDKHQIEINIMARVEDWRLDKGYWTQDKLAAEGFDVNVDPTDSASAIPQAFFGSPEPYDNLAYHIYTGGWIATASVYYQEAAFSQMHAPWYGFMQVYGSDSHWQYDDEGYDDPLGPSDYVRGVIENETGNSNIWDHDGKTVADFDSESMSLYMGTGIETEGEYWDLMVNGAQYGFEEAVRVFACTEISLYPYNPSKMLAAVPEGINGYDTYFGPRTMRTDDGNMDTEILTGQDRPYMDNWNIEGGSSDVYGEYQRRVFREYGTWMNPQSGIPMQVNNYWMNNTELENQKPQRNVTYDLNGNLEKDFYYNETGVLIENITIPDSAVDYVPSQFNVSGEGNYTEVRQWKNATWLNNQGYIEDKKSSVAVTYDPHLEHVWHDGTPMKLRDIMHTYARTKELGDPGTEPFRQATADLNGPWWNSIDAIEWNASAGTYTVYGEYTFPIDAKIGNYFSIYPETHPLTYTGWNQLVAGGDAEYSYDAETGTKWIHQLSTAHSNDMIAALQNMGVPAYLDESNFAGSMSSALNMTESEMDTLVASFDSFVSDTGHSFISIGPYRLDNYDEGTYDMSISQWDDYGYPQAGETGPQGYTWENGFWSEQFSISEINVQNVELVADDVGANNEVYLYDDAETGIVNITGSVSYEELFPDVTEQAISGNYDNFYIKLTEFERGPQVKMIEENNITLTDQATYTDYEATLDVSDITQSGYYAVEVWAVVGNDTYMRARELAIAVDQFYDLTVNSAMGGSTTPAGGTTNTYNALTTQDISATPAQGYEFTGWTGDIPLRKQRRSSISLVMDRNRTITPTFERKMWTLSVNVGQGNGTIEVNGQDVGTSHEAEYGAYTEVNLTAVPAQGYKFLGWDGTAYTTKEITITMDEETEDITANFVEETVMTYDLTVNIQGNGTVEVDGTEVSDGFTQSYAADTTVTLNATADTGWNFDGWTGDIGQADNEIDITMDENMTITANFVEEEEEDGGDGGGGGIPGFTTMLLVAAAVVAVAIYYNKKEK